MPTTEEPQTALGTEDDKVEGEEEAEDETGKANDNEEGSSHDAEKEAAGEGGQ